MMQMPLVRQFITDDEVNADLTRGSGFSGGKARIYNYWQENHSAKEKMDFLKHEYGTGGHSHACSGATHSGQDHDAKGVAYTKSGCDKLQMSWAQVVQRIDGLMRKGRYLSPEEEAERQAIEEAKTDPFKNLFLYTKMRNVAGLSTSEAQKSSDMFMKCRYMDELTGGRGVIFATGTPVSNSMTELYTVMRYLQYSTLQQKNLTHFDSWASTFGETTTAIEFAQVL